MPAGAPDTSWFLPANSSTGLPAPSLFQTANPTLWGDGTLNAGRATPWDTGCIVYPFIGGYETLSATLGSGNPGDPMSVRQALEAALTQARAGQKGLVYVSDWRLNSGRDLTEVGTGKTTRTVLGTLLNIMHESVKAGTPLVKVCVLLWLPAAWIKMGQHQEEHIATARMIQRKNQEFLATAGPTQPSIGSCILDNRVPGGFPTCWIKAHHQKMVVVRAGDVNVAFVGGVDLAFTRRDTPGPVPTALALSGAPQGGTTVTVNTTDGTTPASASYTAGATDTIAQILTALQPKVKAMAGYIGNVTPWRNTLIVAPAAGQSFQISGQVTPATSTLVINPTSPTNAVTTANYTNANPQFLGGDVQSGVMNPPYTSVGTWLPDVDPADLPGGAVENRPTSKFEGDLPGETYFDNQEIWHDHHLMLWGPIVSTVEAQFCERWVDTVDDSANFLPWSNLQALPDSGDVHLEYTWVTQTAIQGTVDPLSGLFQNGTTQIAALDAPQPVPNLTNANATSLVQMWRTIPIRKRDPNDPNKLFQRGEFTVLAGIANAIFKAQNLIFILDQYFFSEPLARLLYAALQARPALRVIVVLPPSADDFRFAQHTLRHNALNVLFGGTTPTTTIGNQVAVYNLWHPAALRGMYVHTKVQTYDGALLVCGSANMNRRSYTCDSELDCAVLDSTVVLAHLQRVWSTLLPTTAWPWSGGGGIDLSGPTTGSNGPGQQFFDAFVAAAAAAGSNLIADPCYDTPFPLMPNLLVRDELALLLESDYTTLAPGAAVTNLNAQILDCGAEILFKELVDPSSLDLGIENAVASAQPATPFGPPAPGRLDSIAYSLAYDPDVWRKSD